MCDLRICSDRAKLGKSYILLGLVPGAGGAFLPPRIVGLPRALELLLTGDAIDVGEALRIAERPSLAVRMMKRAVYQGLTSTLRAHLDCISSQVSLLSGTGDHREAAKAYLEKRAPVFRGQ